MKFATVAATVALSSSLATNALADERQIIVLNLRGNASLSPWPEGTRAVIAELATSDDQVLVRPSASTTFAALMSELEKAATEEQTVGAVCVGKSGSVGIAYVWVNGGSGAIRVEDDMREGAVAEGAVALRVSELLHVRNLNLPSTRKEKPPVAAPPPPPEKPSGPPAFTTWLGVGALTSSDASGPAPMVSVGSKCKPWQEAPRSRCRRSRSTPSSILGRSFRRVSRSASVAESRTRPCSVSPRKVTRATTIRRR
jgi:hypothetical protein